MGSFDFGDFRRHFPHRFIKGGAAFLGCFQKLAKFVRKRRHGAGIVPDMRVHAGFRPDQIGDAYDRAPGLPFSPSNFCIQSS